MSITPIKNMGAARVQDAPQLYNVPAARTTYQIDPGASRVEFTIPKRLFFVKHLLVTGRFADVQGTISFDEQEPANARAEVSIGAASVDTRMGKRDKHLRKADFFDVERHPTLTFMSQRVETIDGPAGRYRVIGDLTVRGVIREAQLDATYTPATSGGPQRRIKLTLTGALNRRDFGMVWNQPYIDVADDLTITLQIEATPA